jgi:hypothetical protein
MPSDVTRDEFKHLTGRVDVVEREVDGEKLVTRHILEHSRRNTEDLARLRTEMKTMRADLTTRIDRVEAKLEARMDGVETHLGRVEAKVDGLTKSLPTIVGGEMRKVMRERRRP